MDSQERKKINVITRYVLDSFSENDWHSLGQLTGDLDVIHSYYRLPSGFWEILRSSAKSRLASQIAEEPANLLLRKPKYRNQMLPDFSKSIISMQPSEKISTVRFLDSWVAFLTSK